MEAAWLICGVMAIKSTVRSADKFVDNGISDKCAGEALKDSVRPAGGRKMIKGFVAGISGTAGAAAMFAGGAIWAFNGAADLNQAGADAIAIGAAGLATGVASLIILRKMDKRD